ncbi:chemotaxis protein CheB [Paucibacter sp. Y2R2-4]|uniref:chemotaxis protein CheB n=1 Tax=Paucibacter sp. Y2R2-4 TaxID=2893553 RepID=UPI0021E4CCA5|nr:chemotaxis protein CheB [Paucibacter sp. Y2R2-4]MCV2351374.1 PAS domain-containing protein [Paucibacter sp. Y2R2-4]
MNEGVRPSLSAISTSTEPSSVGGAAGLPVPVVAVGASAGGLAAFEAFFAGLSAQADLGMAVVLLQHLAPDFNSLLTELIQRHTRLPVREVEDGMLLQADHVYVIPPDRDMACLNGRLQLLEPAAKRGHRLPIDFFFRSLALDLGERAVAIVLSGTGSDGSHGLRDIKAHGGLVLVQSPASAEFDGMPRAALATGVVDFEMPASDMGAKLLAYARHGGARLRPSESSGKQESELRKIFVLLRAQTGHDFSNYKPTTICRRIDRRMAVHQIESVEAYARYLQQSPAEVEALFRDLLIGVTNFFRDPEAFQALAQLGLPSLFEGKEPGSVIRVWVAGCSTGEEAYSIAMLLLEHLKSLPGDYRLQVFASDIDSRAIASAREGRYPSSIAAHVSPERLAQFFVAETEGSGYRVRKSLRDHLVFSEHDLIKDPPFSKLDMISCRNLLIYLGSELQKRLIPLFHYALRPGGCLFLGSSEGVGEFDALFYPVDRKAKLFRRQADVLGQLRPGSGRLPVSLPQLSALRLAALGASSAAVPMRGGAQPANAMKPSLRELTEQALLLQVVPAGALVNEQGDILYLHGRTGLFLELAPGEVGVNNILKMAREGLRHELSMALHKAVTLKDTVKLTGLRVRSNSHVVSVNLTVRPVIQAASQSPQASLFLVILEEAPGAPVEAEPLVTLAPSEAGEGSVPGSLAASPLDDSARLLTSLRNRVEELERELRAKDEYLQSTQEELESANEELKSANEEMQSVNEELQSANEELETSKEELQSVNEELATVNTELNTKVVDLSRANNDMNNLLAGTGIGTVFVDHQLRILRFTPAATQFIHLIQSDTGRPVGHLVSKLVGYDRLVPDVQAVLDSLMPKSIEVETTEGRWCTMRIQPYRTLDNVIEGAVISFVDISDMVRARQQLHDAHSLTRLAVVVRDAADAVVVQDLSGRILAWNPAATQLYGWSEAEALAMNLCDRVPVSLRAQGLEELLRSDQTLPLRTQRLNKAGVTLDVTLTTLLLRDSEGRNYAVASTERCLTSVKPLPSL